MRKDPDRTDEKRLADMRESVRRIREIMDLRREEFRSNLTAQEAVAFQLMALGDAAERMSKRTKNTNDDIPWTALADFRWALAHAYFTTDLSLTWNFVHRQLNGLERRLRRVRVAPGAAHP